ncbi:uncharacterized protein [Cardiocondyla obscurior]|uniref:uncharacterized protein n=1 Tax=Cardiocondyla obscurior TaxID=286306 RepID=UPI0039657A5A
MSFHIVLYNAYCLTVPTTWINFEKSIFYMPHKTKHLTQACIKQSSPRKDWNEICYDKIYGPYESYKDARATEKVISDMSTSDDNIVAHALAGNAEKPKRLLKKRKFYGNPSNNEGMYRLHYTFKCYIIILFFK